MAAMMNMEVGNEISSKIRSAIKAKLVELNAYVDEELPDYIMVMVANKKSQHQMADDLGLFLGANTETFTTWLQALLHKLQSITSENSSAIFGTGKPEKVVEKIKPAEQSLASDVAGKHKKNNDESKSKKRTSDEGSEEKKQRKRRKSDQEKKSKITDEVKTKQVPEIDVAEIDNASSKASSLPEPTVLPEKDNTDSIPVSPQVEKIASQKPEKLVENTVEAESESIIESEEQAARTVETSTSKQDANTHGQPSGIDASDIQVEDDDLTELLLTENDELTEELEQETAVVLPVKKSDVKIRNSNEDLTSSKSKRVITASVESLRDRSPPRSSRPRAVMSPIRQSGRRSALVRAVEPRPSDVSSRKRRGPISVVGSVSRDSEEEEGYDPRNPAVGNVASVVKVTARKSSVPAKMQANKSLLLKAMTEAEKSVENQRRVAVTPVRPFMRSEGPRDKDRDRERERERGERVEKEKDLREREQRSREHDRERPRGGGHSSSSGARGESRESRGGGDSRRHSPTPRIAQASLRQAIAQPRSSRQSPPVYIPTRKVQPALRMESSDKAGLTSKSRRREAEDRAWLDREKEAAPPPRKTLRTEKPTPIVNFVIEAEYDTDDDVSRQPTDEEHRRLSTVKKEPASPRKKPTYVEPAKRSLSPEVTELDSRVVEYEAEVVVVDSPAHQVLSECDSQGVPALLEDMDHEEFLLDQDVLELTDSSTALLEEDQRQALVKEKPTAKDRTRFVVTLDGVDTDQYEISAMETTASPEEEMEVDKLQGAYAPQHPLAPPHPPTPAQFAAKDAPPVLMSPPKIQPLNINLKDSDEEGEAMEAEAAPPLKMPKMVERCKFWPACANGAACGYHHPTVHCKTFPLCKFGDKCLYIHPNCRFDAKCARPDCPFTHSGPRPMPPPFLAPYMPPVYRAPPPPPPPPPVVPMPAALQCKFFPQCTNMACLFFHPKPCRFGRGCKNKDKGCPFYHPPLPTADKLTWVASASKDALLSEAAALAARDKKKAE